MLVHHRGRRLDVMMTMKGDDGWTESNQFRKGSQVMVRQTTEASMRMGARQTELSYINEPLLTLCLASDSSSASIILASFALGVLYGGSQMKLVLREVPQLSEFQCATLSALGAKKVLVSASARRSIGLCK